MNGVLEKRIERKGGLGWVGSLLCGQRGGACAPPAGADDPSELGVLGAGVSEGGQWFAGVESAEGALEGDAPSSAQRNVPHWASEGGQVLSGSAKSFRNVEEVERGGNGRSDVVRQPIGRERCARENGLGGTTRTFGRNACGASCPKALASIADVAMGLNVKAWLAGGDCALGPVGSAGRVAWQIVEDHDIRSFDGIVEFAQNTACRRDAGDPNLGGVSVAGGKGRAKGADVWMRGRTQDEHASPLFEDFDGEGLAIVGRDAFSVPRFDGHAAWQVADPRCVGEEANAAGEGFRGLRPTDGFSLDDLAIDVEGDGGRASLGFAVKRHQGLDRELVVEVSDAVPVEAVDCTICPPRGIAQSDGQQGSHGQARPVLGVDTPIGTTIGEENHAGEVSAFVLVGNVFERSADVCLDARECDRVIGGQRSGDGRGEGEEGGVVGLA